MATDPAPALRAQLIADRDAMAPQIRGLPDIAATSVSADMIVAINQQLHIRQRRRDLINAVLEMLDGVTGALDLLEADGWPTPVSVSTLSASLFEELRGEQSDVAAAVAVFKAEQAASIAVRLGDPVPKT